MGCLRLIVIVIVIILSPFATTSSKIKLQFVNKSIAIYNVIGIIHHAFEYSSPRGAT